MSVKHCKMLLLVLLVFPGWVTLAETAALSLEIPETVVVSGPRITLGDLGKIQGGSISDREYLQKIDFGAAPFPGASRIFKKDYILNVIRLQQFSKEILVIGTEVKVTVDAVCIKNTDLEKAINDILPKPKPVIIKKWLELNNVPKEKWLYKDNWEIKAVPIGSLPELGPVLFKVVISNEKGRQQEINISGKIRETAIVYRVTRDLPRQAEIKPNDLEPVEMELSSGKELLGEIQGRIRTMKLIRQGEVLRVDQVQPVPLVHKDQEVVVIVRSEKVEVTLVGVAKTDGWLGDEIVIINPTSKKNFRGRVLNENTVEVILK